MLLCAGILGRYYTDSHDVDEDKRTILRQGEHWPGSTFTGIVMRFLFDDPSILSSDVASRKIYLSQHHFFHFLMMFVSPNVL